MRRWQAIVAVCVLGACVACVRGDDTKKEDSYKDLIVATWVPAGARGKAAQSISLEFTKDGNVSYTFPQRGGQSATLNGSFTIKGKKLQVTWQSNGRKTPQAFKISKLTEKDLVLVDQQGQTRKYKHE
jgi:uncharacterized protein (TIGR03066 family)